MVGIDQIAIRLTVVFGQLLNKGDVHAFHAYQILGVKSIVLFVGKLLKILLVLLERIE
jgi:hypothetical protein